MTRTLARDRYLTPAEWSYRLRLYRRELARHMRECRREAAAYLARVRKEGKGLARQFAFRWADGSIPSAHFAGVRTHDRAWPVAPGARARKVAAIREWAVDVWERADSLPCGHQDALGERIAEIRRIAHYLELYCVTR